MYPGKSYKTTAVEEGAGKIGAPETRWRFVAAASSSLAILFVTGCNSRNSRLFTGHRTGFSLV